MFVVHLVGGNLPHEDDHTAPVDPVVDQVGVTPFAVSFVSCAFLS